MYSLKNNNFLIVGGSSGIGLALVSQLNAAEANTFTASRNQADAADNRASKYLRFDVISDEMTALQNFIPETLHGLVYCPGSINLKPFSRLQISDFQKDLEINLFGTVKVIQSALPALKKSGSSSIVLFSTVAARVGMNFHASIAAAKAAIQGLAISLAAELASANIRVNVIAPSITQTPLAQHLLSSEQKVTASATRHPLSRIGQPEEIAATAVFLLSPQSGWITGQIIGVDGGLANLKPL